MKTFTSGRGRTSVCKSAVLTVGRLDNVTVLRLCAPSSNHLFTSEESIDCLLNLLRCTIIIIYQFLLHYRENPHINLSIWVRN